MPVTQTVFSITPVPPFRLDLTAWALRRRPENAIDDWNGTSRHDSQLYLKRSSTASLASNSLCLSRIALPELNLPTDVDLSCFYAADVTKVIASHVSVWDI